MPYFLTDLIACLLNESCLLDLVVLIALKKVTIVFAFYARSIIVRLTLKSFATSRTLSIRLTI